MPFEVFDKRTAPMSSTPSITIQKRGLFSINRAAHALIDNAPTVELLYDRERNIVGIRPVADDTPHGYTVRPQTTKTNNGPVIVAGTKFTQYYDIPTEISRRWEPRMEGDVLCVDLATPGVEIVGNRSVRSSDVSTEE